MNDETQPDETIQEPAVHVETDEITLAAIQDMTQEQRMQGVLAYRKLIGEGKLLNKVAHSNAIRLLRAVRSRAIELNPHAKKTAKKKAEVSFDLGEFLN